MTPIDQANAQTFIRPLGELKDLWARYFFVPLVARLEAVGLEPEWAITTNYSDDIRADIKFKDSELAMSFELETQGASYLISDIPKGGFGVGTLSFFFVTLKGLSYPGNMEYFWLEEYFARPDTVTTFEELVEDVYSRIPKLCRIDSGFIDTKLDQRKEYMEELRNSLKSARKENSPSVHSYIRFAKQAATDINLYDMWLHQLGSISDAVS